VKYAGFSLASTEMLIWSSFGTTSQFRRGRIGDSRCARAGPTPLSDGEIRRAHNVEPAGMRAQQILLAAGERRVA
jgi:hypothetical protein